MLLSRLGYYLSSIPTLLSGIRHFPIVALRLLTRSSPNGFVNIELSNGVKFQVRTLMDIWIIKETCLDHDYERASVNLVDGWSIIDIGAGLGDFTISAAKLQPRSTVYAYEPFPQSYQLLQSHLTLNQVKNVRAFPIAIADHNGQITLDAISSPEAVQHSTVSNQGNIAVQCVTLDTLFASGDGASGGTTNGPSRCDFLKCDCEGAEYGIFLNASPATLAKIQHICLEYHDGVTSHSHTDLEQFFRANGFEVNIHPNPVHANLGFLYARRK